MDKNFKTLDELEEEAMEDPLDATPDKALDKLDQASSKRENPHDTKGTGRTDDEPNDIPGEQNGMELDIHAENRPRNSDGEFEGKDDYVFFP